MPKTIKDWTNQVLFAGIDLHKNKWVITVRTQDVILKTFVSLPEKEVLLRSLQHQWSGAEIHAVYEAGCFGYHLADFLNSKGIKTIIVAPHTIPVAPGQFVKTDTIDSRKLALELAKGSLTGIYQRPATELYDRALIRKRQQLIKRRVQIHNQLKGDMAFYGLACAASKKKYWSKRTLAELKQISIGPESFQVAMRLVVEEYEFLREQIRSINSLLTELGDSERYRHQMERLCSIPGIGKLSAITILLEIGDIHRFTNAQKFASYLGLTPSEHSSGDTIRKGSLTGMGHSSLRKLIVEVSWTAIKKDPILLDKFQRLSVGKSRCKAIVAVAKSLANRIRKVLKDDEPYVIGVVC
jgi:transposase